MEDEAASSEFQRETGPALDPSEPDFRRNWGEDMNVSHRLDAHSRKEENTNVSELPDEEKIALIELKQLVREALETSQLTRSKSQEPWMKDVQTEGKNEEIKSVGATKEAAASAALPLLSPYQDRATDPPEEVSAKPSTEEVFIWGAPLLKDERSDVILLKFLRARDFIVKDSFTMLQDTIRWRKEFGIDELADEELEIDSDFEKVVFMKGHDREGHPVCYNIFGEFQDKEIYRKALSDEEKRHKFLKWRIRFLERSIRKLDFRPGGISTILQVNDLKHSPGLGKKELRQATREALQVLQDNYPEFLAKQVFVNVPWWYLAFCKMISPFLTQRTKDKFVFAGPSKTAETLSRYISAEQIPVKYGGLNHGGEFGVEDSVTEVPLKPASKHSIELPISKDCVLIWELRVNGWEVKYSAEFNPSSLEGYTVIIQKVLRVGVEDHPLIIGTFNAGEPGTVVLSVDNPTTKKKKLLYRFKSKSLVV